MLADPSLAEPELYEKARRGSCRAADSLAVGSARGLPPLPPQEASIPLTCLLQSQPPPLVASNPRAVAVCAASDPAALVSPVLRLSPPPLPPTPLPTPAFPSPAKNCLPWKPSSPSPPRLLLGSFKALAPQLLSSFGILDLGVFENSAPKTSLSATFPVPGKRPPFCSFSWESDPIFPLLHRDLILLRVPSLGSSPFPDSLPFRLLWKDPALPTLINFSLGCFGVFRNCSFCQGKFAFSLCLVPRGLNDTLAMNAARSGYRVFSANSTAACTELAKRITERLGAELGKSVVYQETNGETRVEIKESVRGQDVFIIQTIPRDVNTAVMELLIMAYALKTSCAKTITGVIPYFPYSKQSKMRKRGSIVCKLLASMLAKAGLSHIITMDLHQKEIQGFFSFPVDNLRASPFLLQYIQEEIPDYRNAVIVAKSPDAAKRAQSYAERLRLGLAVIHGEAQCTEQDMDDGRHSPPMAKNTTVCTGLELPMMMAKEKPPITVVGDVGGRIAIIVDDIIDDVESFVAAAEILKERGAYKIFIMATHGLLSADAPRLIEESSIDEVVVTNTVPHEVQKLQCPKIKTVDISLILSEAIRRIHNGESMAYLFRNITMDD